MKSFAAFANIPLLDIVALNIHEINLTGRRGRGRVGEVNFKVIKEPLRGGERNFSRHRKVRNDLATPRFGEGNDAGEGNSGRCGLNPGLELWLPCPLTLLTAEAGLSVELVGG